MCITEYNEAETLQMIREEGIEEGIKEGIEKGYDELLRNLVKAGDLSPEKAAKYARMAREQSL